MTKDKKKVPSPRCVKCGELLKRINPLDNLCTKCRSRLPECVGCHAIMAPEFGYMSRPGKKVGKHEICDACEYELNKKGYLRISQGRGARFLMPDGRVKIEK